MKRLCVAAPLALLAVSFAFACGPQALPGPGRPFFDWTMAEDPYFIEIVSSDFLESGGLSEDKEYEWAMGHYVDEWVAFLQLDGGDQDRAKVRAMLVAADPFAEYSNNILAGLSQPAHSATGIRTYFSLLSESSALDREWDDAAVGPAEPGSLLAKRQALAKKASKALRTLSEPFLRQRVALIALKAYALMPDLNMAEGVYREYFAAAADGALRASARGWLARAKLASGNRLAAIGDYVALMDQYPESAVSQVASLNAVSASEAEWDEVTRALPKGHRRAMAYFARSLLDPHKIGSRYMLAMYQEEPGSAHLTKLLIRAMREIDWQDLSTLYARAGIGPRDAKPTIPRAKLEDMARLCRSVVEGGGARDPGLFVAARAHILLILGDVAAAQATLDSAKPLTAGFGIAGRAEYAWHSWLCALINRSAQRGQLFIDAIKAVEAWRPRDGHMGFISEAYAFFGEWLLEQGDAGAAILAFRLAPEYEGVYNSLIDIYASVDELGALMGKENPTGSLPEALTLRSRVSIPTDELRYSIATRLLRERDYAKAFEAYSHIDPEFWAKAAESEMYSPFEELAPVGTILYSDPVAAEPLDDNPAPTLTLRRDDMAKLLARLEADGEWERIGWIYISTPYVAYNDLLWRGGMVYGANDGALLSWPCLGLKSAKTMMARKKAFLELYDSKAIGADYLVKAMAERSDPDERALLAFGALQAYIEESYSQTLGPATRRAERTESLMATIKRDRQLRPRVARLGSGCPGLKALR